MNYLEIIEERVKIALEKLSKQSPCTLMEAKAQVEQVRTLSSTAIKKRQF